MKLRDFLSELNNLAKENPKALDYDVIYSSDDEGNSYHSIYCTGTFVQVEDLDAHHLDIVFKEGDEEINYNAVIIN